MCRVDVTRINEGLWRWSVRRDGHQVASAYLEHGDMMLLVDPVLPPPGDDLDRFARAIERDLARLAGPAWVMLTRAWEPRDADALTRMTGAATWVPGDPLPAAMQALPTGRDGEAALWSEVHRALMPGTALHVHAGRLVGAPGVDAAALLAMAPDVVVPSLGPMAP